MMELQVVSKFSRYDGGLGRTLSPVPSSNHLVEVNKASYMAANQHVFLANLESGIEPSVFCRVEEENTFAVELEVINIISREEMDWCFFESQCLDNRLS
jgi:hypothetical protein